MFRYRWVLITLVLDFSGIIYSSAGVGGLVIPNRGGNTKFEIRNSKLCDDRIPPIHNQRMPVDLRSQRRRQE
jgi:hypothetical protein